MFAEKIPVHLILASMCFVIYVIKQQITADLNARVERLTADFTSRDATFIIEGQRIMAMVNTVIETINEITANYKSLCGQMDHLTEAGSIASLRSEKFNTHLHLILPKDLLTLLSVAQVIYRFPILSQQPGTNSKLFLIGL